MRQIVEILQYHYTVRGVSNMFLVNALDFIHSSSVSLILSRAEIADLLRKLAEIAPEWIKILENPQGQLLRLNKEYPIFRVFADIKAI